MKTLVISPAAEMDLEHIWDHSVEIWGLDQADRYLDQIRDACLGLASSDRRGRPVDVRAGYLKYATGVHMVYFRDHVDRLEVMRELHQRQDVSRNLPA